MRIDESCVDLQSYRQFNHIKKSFPPVQFCRKQNENAYLSLTSFSLSVFQKFWFHCIRLAYTSRTSGGKLRLDKAGPSYGQS